MKGMKKILVLAALAAFMVLSTTETTHAVDWTIAGNYLAAEGGYGYLGSLDDSVVYVIVDGQVAYQWEPNDTVPNIIGGESVNTVLDSAYGATICGGGYDAPSGTDYPNVVADDWGFVGGGRGNQAGTYDNYHYTHMYAAVVGGYANGAWGSYSFVGGGYDDIVAIGAGYGTIGGGRSNDVTDDYGTVCGGYANSSSTYGTVGGGYSNLADYYGTVGGGENNLADDYGTVGGGTNCNASGYYATVGGGSWNTASGEYAMVPGGMYNDASGDLSFGAGYRAHANYDGCFMWGDSTNSDVYCPGSNTFNVRAAGGLWFGSNSNPSIPQGRFINTTTGAYLTTGGAWTDASSPAVKTDIEPIDPGAVLDTLRDLSVSEWSYVADSPGVRHMGPMADDFYALFGLGNDPTGIASLDTAGVALAAIQALDQKVQGLEAEVAGMRAEAAKLQGLDDELKGRLAQVTQLQERLAKLEKERNETLVQRAALTDVNQLALLVLALLLAGVIGLVYRRSRVRDGRRPGAILEPRAGRKEKK